MKFSVVTPCRNRRDHLPAAIESVLAQGYRDFEHLIVDAASTDGTLATLARYAHLKVVSEPDAGVYDGMNKGVARADGDVVVLLNSDDVLAPGAFQVAADLLRTGIGTMLVSGGCEIFRRTPAGHEVVMHRYVQPRRHGLSVRNATIGHPFINARFFRRKVFERVGKFDLRYPIAADRDFLLRAALARLPDAPIPRVLYRYLWHPGSLTMNAGNASLLQGMQDGLQIADRYLAEGRLTSEEAACVRQWRRETCAQQVMIQTVNGALPAAVTTLVSAARREPQTMLTLARLGSLAVGRRLRTWYRVREAEKP